MIQHFHESLPAGVNGVLITDGDDLAVIINSRFVADCIQSGDPDRCREVVNDLYAAQAESTSERVAV